MKIQLLLPSEQGKIIDGYKIIKDIKMLDMEPDNSIEELIMYGYPNSFTKDTFEQSFNFICSKIRMGGCIRFVICLAETLLVNKNSAALNDSINTLNEIIGNINFVPKALDFYSILNKNNMKIDYIKKVGGFLLDCSVKR